MFFITLNRKVNIVQDEPHKKRGRGEGGVSVNSVAHMLLNCHAREL
jgi:hypothetical protein